MLLFDSPSLIALNLELRLSMRKLLQELCRELQDDYAELAAQLAFPTDAVQFLSRSVKAEDLSNWKVVGWIESLNDFVYFLDIWQQWRTETDRREFAEQLFAECQEKFFENSYLDELFPKGKPQVSGLEGRLARLCKRLAQDIAQEALWLDPAAAAAWCRARKVSQWNVPGSLAQNFEKAEEAGAVPLGVAGDQCEAPSSLKRLLTRAAGRATFRVDALGVSVKAGRTLAPIWTVVDGQAQWHWAVRPTAEVLCTTDGAVTVGSTLIYGKNRQPKKVVPTDSKQAARIRRAWETIQAAWPEGHEVLALLTSRIIPLNAKGVVSFSFSSICCEKGCAASPR